MPVCRVILLEERPAAVAHRVTKARLVGTAAKAAPPRGWNLPRRRPNSGLPRPTAHQDDCYFTPLCVRAIFARIDDRASD
jgi:hypothetical protein